ncbi:conjugal transfer protein TraO [Alistipes senegalensis]|uniref:conjugal transfer protein TraO n=1 Tax=Alistipes senegalensis TaxID=1288121 RepID=UPI00242D6899|nr:conjugal transfer protein TraO [Alistipes senegalensis]
MRRIALFLSLALCLAAVLGTYAQRTLPGMRSVELRAGMADGWYSSSGRSTTGYYFGAAIGRYARSANKWVVGAEYLYRNYAYRTGSIPIAQFTAEGGYYYKFFTDGSKTFYLYLGGSALAGYETVNWGKKRLYDGATILSRDRFLYGGAVTLEADAYITDRIVFFLSGRERVLWGTTTGHFHTQFGVGIKFILD